MGATNLSAAEVYIEDTPLNLVDIVIFDSVTATATLTLSDAAARALTTGTSGAVTSTYDSATGIWSASGPIADVNALLAAVTFTPAENFNGNFSIATSVSDDAGTATGSKLITGTAVNDAPVAADDSYTTIENTALAVPAPGILDNDSDVDGTALTASVTSPPANGTVALDPTTGAFVYTPDPNFNGTDSFTYVAIDAGAPLPALTSNVATVTLTVTPTADLAVTKTVSDATPNVGDQIIFTVTLSNLSPDDATGVQVIDLLPVGVSLVSANLSQGTYDPGSGVWNVGTVSSAVSQTLSITATVDSPAAQTNTGTISAADQFDPNTANNTASVTETPQQADLAVTKTVSDATPNVDDQIIFTVGLFNPGPDDATGVQVTDLLPAGVSLVSANPSQGTYDTGSGVWNVGTVSSGVPQTLSITATVDSPAAQTNTATISAADQFDPNTANNTASATETPPRVDDDFNGDGNSDVLWRQDGKRPGLCLGDEWLTDRGRRTCGGQHQRLAHPGRQRLQRRLQQRHPLAPGHRPSLHLGDEWSADQRRGQSAARPSHQRLAHRRHWRFRRRLQERHPLAARQRAGLRVGDGWLERQSRRQRDARPSHQRLARPGRR
jgi:uncharacterized repeat protein (TIGR01451 family)